MQIRPMERKDYHEVYELWLRTPGMGLTDLDDSEEGIARFLARNPKTCFVARDGDRLLGVILGGGDGRRGYLYHMAVEAAEQGKGIGTRLLEACLEGFRSEGIRKVALVVFGHNESGNRFWDRRGFAARPDLSYRTLDLVEMKAIHT